MKKHLDMYLRGLWDSSVGIATAYELDGLGANPEGGEIFRSCPDRPWDLPSLLYDG